MICPKATHCTLKSYHLYPQNVPIIRALLTTTITTSGSSHCRLIFPGLLQCFLTGPLLHLCLPGIHSLYTARIIFLGFKKATSSFCSWFLILQEAKAKVLTVSHRALPILFWTSPPNGPSSVHHRPYRAFLKSVHWLSLLNGVLSATSLWSSPLLPSSPCSTVTF